MSANKDLLDMSLDEITKMNRKNNGGKLRRQGDSSQRKPRGYHPYKPVSSVDAII